MGRKLACSRKRGLGDAAVAHALRNDPGLVFGEVAPIRDRLDGAALERKHQRQRRESLNEVVADGLPHLVLRTRVVEHVVRDLKREAELRAVTTEGAARPTVESSESAADVAA